MIQWTILDREYLSLLLSFMVLWLRTDRLCVSHVDLGDEGKISIDVATQVDCWKFGCYIA